MKEKQWFSTVPLLGVLLGDLVSAKKEIAFMGAAWSRWTWVQGAPGNRGAGLGGVQGYARWPRRLALRHRGAGQDRKVFLSTSCTRTVARCDLICPSWAGRSVVVNNVTHEVLQAGGGAFKL